MQVFVTRGTQSPPRRIHGTSEPEVKVLSCPRASFTVPLGTAHRESFFSPCSNTTDHQFYA